MKRTFSESGICIILPAYNERDKIVPLIRRIRKFGYSNIITVDDGSSDGTGEVALGAGSKVIRNEINRGVGHALKLGLIYAIKSGYDIAVIMGGDAQDDPAEIEKLTYPILKGNFDIVQGSRYLGGKHITFPIKRVFTGLFSLLFSLRVAKRFTDASNGYRAINLRTVAPLIRLLAETPGIDRYEFEPLLLLLAVRCGLKITEVPVSKYYDIEKGYSKMKPFISWFQIVRPLMVPISILPTPFRTGEGYSSDGSSEFPFNFIIQCSKFWLSPIFDNSVNFYYGYNRFGQESVFNGRSESINIIINRHVGNLGQICNASLIPCGILRKVLEESFDLSIRRFITPFPRNLLKSAIKKMRNEVSGKCEMYSVEGVSDADILLNISFRIGNRKVRFPAVYTKDNNVVYSFDAERYIRYLLSGFGRPFFTFLPFGYRTVPERLKHYLLGKAADVFLRTRDGNRLFDYSGGLALDILRISLPSAIRKILGKKVPYLPILPHGKKIACLTFDIDSIRNVYVMKRIMASFSRDIPFTLFITSSAVKKALKSGPRGNGKVEFASHGYDHNGRLPYMNPFRTIKILYDIFGKLGYNRFGFRMPQLYFNPDFIGKYSSFFLYDSSAPYFMPDITGVRGIYTVNPFPITCNFMNRTLISGDRTVLGEDGVKKRYSGKYGYNKIFNPFIFEIPVNLPFDYLFRLYGFTAEKSVDITIRGIKRLTKIGSPVTLLYHPDSHLFPHGASDGDPFHITEPVEYLRRNFVILTGSELAELMRARISGKVKPNGSLSIRLGKNLFTYKYQYL